MSIFFFLCWSCMHFLHAVLVGCTMVIVLGYMCPRPGNNKNNLCQGFTEFVSKTPSLDAIFKSSITHNLSTHVTNQGGFVTCYLCRLLAVNTHGFTHTHTHTPTHTLYIKAKLLGYLWNHFITNFAFNNTCSHSFLYPCFKCSKNPC